MKERCQKFIALLLILFTTHALALGQPSPTPNAPASRQDVLKLFKVMHIRDQMRSGHFLDQPIIDTGSQSSLEPCLAPV